ncbi:MAG: lactate utilization protein [Synergistaceae bacterium]|nr:lactate utilization protein [Synergistaceae bacterium]
MNKLLDPLKQTNEALGRKICGALLANGYKTAEYAEDAQGAVEIAIGMIPDEASVGIPGTVTVRQTGLIGRLEEKKCRIFHHWDPSLTPETRPSRLAEENAADWFVTSSNAVTYDGKMVNIDGTGNRIAGMAWGRNSILYIIGINKAARDVESAIKRSRDAATPPNSVRVGADAPCVKLGRCVDCNAPDRTCRAVLILERAPFGRDAHVIIVGEALGY